MRLGEAQEMFMLLLPRLIDHIHEQGYKIRGGDLFRDSRVHGEYGVKVAYGKKNSNHKLKLAIDLNLMSPEGVYIEDDTGHLEFGAFWESLHDQCRSGVRYNDANHYEFCQHSWRD